MNELSKELLKLIEEHDGDEDALSSAVYYAHRAAEERSSERNKAKYAGRLAEALKIMNVPNKIKGFEIEERVGNDHVSYGLHNDVRYHFTAEFSPYYEEEYGKTGKARVTCTFSGKNKAAWVPLENLAEFLTVLLGYMRVIYDMFQEEYK